ncbi:GNAT family N-acetyltransferase [Paractinoplanes lichenicola]|uniref:GNAT family N-acetyltransferase n=1 Tax=Paractinoplanes lichenicola TaxID=2802976 RepID=A0ABS1VXV4_9ACTN|nr:GNAT family protein [Actinoplanes lichenicola]MBL7259325.1 GNAT family N-acetyltransferase [Actinoplanes lichenicola]
MALVDIWPVLGIGVHTPTVDLFVPDQEALEALARLAARGIYDPQNQYLPRTPVGGWEDVASPEAERRFLRYYWAAFADWRPEKWNLMLAARIDGVIVGVQEIGAQHFAVTRTVSTGSWVGRQFQGAGYGTALREAVLHLAFDGLRAERADTAAWVTNHASLGVSRAMGYQENGTTTRAADGKRVEQVNLTLRHSDWRRSPEACTVVGLSPGASEMLGLPSTPNVRTAR